jgi:hypothetical protein
VRKQEAKIENPSTARPQKVAGMTQPDAASIAVKNIFSPDRKDFPAQSSDTRKVVRPQIILYGTTIGDDYQFASIVNPGRSLLRGERETMSLKVGDKVGDYKLAKVLPDRIVMEGGEDSFEVLLYDAKAPKKRTEVRTESKPAAVTSTLPTVPAPGAPKTTPPAVAEKAPPVPPANNSSNRTDSTEACFSNHEKEDDPRSPRGNSCDAVRPGASARTRGELTREDKEI